MSSLLQRTFILSVSRLANQAVVLLSPMLLVRILSVGEYGSYREFIVYTGLIGTIIRFGIPHSLAYFVPRYPDREKIWITQTALFTLATSCGAIALIYLLAELIRANTSFDLVAVLQLYILFASNLDFVEYYWLGKKRTDYVLFYSTGRLVVRVAVITTTAYFTENAKDIVVSMVILEAVRCLLIFWYAVAKGWFTFNMKRSTIALQASYALPLGSGAAVEVLNSSAGTLFISTMLGPAALAFYVIGMFAKKIVNLLRGAIADVIFPEIVELNHAEPKDALPLWQRATIWYCVLIFPMAVVVSYYADAFVTILFTSEYKAAIPVFIVFSLTMILDCFDFHMPLRVQNANRFFVVGSVIALCVNLAVLYPMYLTFGLLGPAVAFILSRLMFTIFLGYSTARLYKVRLAELVYWRDISKIAAVTLVCVPILIAGKHLTDNFYIRGVLFGGLYIVVYLALIRWAAVWDVLILLRRLVRSGQRRTGVNGRF